MVLLRGRFIGDKRETIVRGIWKTSEQRRKEVN